MTDLYIDKIEAIGISYDGSYSGDDGTCTIYTKNAIYSTPIKPVISAGLAPLEVVSGNDTLDGVYCADPVVIATICQLAAGEEYNGIESGNIPLVPDADAWLAAHESMADRPHRRLPHSATDDSIRELRLSPI